MHSRLDLHQQLTLKPSAPTLSRSQSSLRTDKLDVLPELYEPLDSTLQLIVRDFIEWW